MKKLTTEKFIQKAKEIHGDKYDYSKVNFINTRRNVIIICNKHKEFSKKADSHLRGQGCQMCSAENKGKINIKTQ